MAGFKIDMSQTSTQQGQSGLDIGYVYTDAQGNTHFLTKQEAQEMGLIPGDQQTTTQNNPFQDLAGQTNAGRHSDSTADLEKTEETTGSINKDAEENTKKTEDSYDGKTGTFVGNVEQQKKETETTTGTIIEHSPNLPNVSRSGVPTQNYVSGALITAVGLTIIGVAIQKIVKHGVRPSTAQRRRETKLNAQSKRYFSVQSQYRQQEKFMKSSEKKEDKIFKDIQKAETKIQKGKLNNKNNIRLVNAYSKGSKNKKDYKNNIIGNAIYTKDTLTTHRSVIQDEAKIAALSAKKPTESKIKKINQIKNQHDSKIEQFPLGTTDSSIHYAAQLPNMYSDASEVHNPSTIPLYIHRAITDNESLNSVLDKAHEILHYADNKVKVCKINLYNTAGEEIMSLGGSFDNEIGYKVIKSALLQQVKELKKECSDIDKVVLYENSIGGKPEQSVKTYILNVDKKNNNIAAFHNETIKAEMTLKKFNSLYTKTKNSQDQSF